jgi:hypothetical protein
MDMDIPENNFSQLKEIKVVKLNTPPTRPTPTPSMHSKIIRNPQPKQNITYDDIMKKMGMCVVDGKMHFMGEYSQTQTQKAPTQPKHQRVPIEVAPQNSYIYNKYFKDDLKETPEIRTPKNAVEYRNMLIQDIIQRERIKRMKSKQLFVTNIDNTLSQQPRMTEQQLNKLFYFSNGQK